MEQESTSFWTDIKKYEEILTKDPASYCFAPLAELYRKLGLLDDALAVAQRGSAVHPDYVGGQLALGRIYFDKGMKAESRTVLEQVVKATPDNIQALKLLAQLQVEAGETSAANVSLQEVLRLNPADLESRVLLDSLDGEGGGSGQAADGWAEEEDIRDDLEILEDLAEWPEELEASAAIASEQSVVEPIDGMAEAGGIDTCKPTEAPGYDDDRAMEGPDPDSETLTSLAEEPAIEVSPRIDPFAWEEPEASPGMTGVVSFEGKTETQQPAEASRNLLTTATLAELYVSQGFTAKAIDIYRELVHAEPDNDRYRSRLAELQELVTDISAPAATGCRPFDIEETSLLQPTEEISATATAVHADRDQVVTVLEGWLENIKRRR